MPRAPRAPVDGALMLLHQAASTPYNMDLLAPQWQHELNGVRKWEHRAFLEDMWKELHSATDSVERDQLREKINRWNDKEFPTRRGYR